MKERKFQDRRARKLIRYINNCSEYMPRDHIRNCQKIKKFFEDDYKQFKKKRKMCLSEIAKHTNLNPKSVKSAIHTLSFKIEPVLQFNGWMNFGKDGGKKSRTMVKLNKNYRVEN
jgi:hypothetical protein